MADIKRDNPDSRPMYRMPEGGEEIERRLEDSEDGRDPTARRGEIEEGGYVTDEDVGKDEIERKAITGYGAEGERAQANDRVKPEGGKPLTDNSRDKEDI